MLNVLQSVMSSFSPLVQCQHDKSQFWRGIQEARPMPRSLSWAMWSHGSLWVLQLLIQNQLVVIFFAYFWDDGDMLYNFSLECFMFDVKACQHKLGNYGMLGVWRTCHGSWRVYLWKGACNSLGEHVELIWGWVHIYFIILLEMKVHVQIIVLCSPMSPGNFDSSPTLTAWSNGSAGRFYFKVSAMNDVGSGEGVWSPAKWHWLSSDLVTSGDICPINW